MVRGLWNGCRLPFDGCVQWTLTKVLVASTGSFPEQNVVTYMTVSRGEHRELHATRLFLHLLALVYMWIHRPERGRGDYCGH